MESRGERVFIAFRRDTLTAWRARPQVRAREYAFRRGASGISACPNVGYYVCHATLLSSSPHHSYGAGPRLQHQLAARADLRHAPGRRILIHTGASDAEGILGGLVQAGKRLDRYLRMAGELGRLCSNDPVCAQHAPDSAPATRASGSKAVHLVGFTRSTVSPPL